MSEVHAKLFLIGWKGAVKEVRRVGFHNAVNNVQEWPTLSQFVASMFSSGDVTITYEDPEKDRVSLDCQLEWDECMQLGPYTVHNPLKLFVKRKQHKEGPASRQEPEMTQSDAPREMSLETVHAYTTGSTEIPEDVDRLKDVVPTILMRYMNTEGPGLPRWLIPAVACNPCSQEFDVDIQALAHRFHSRALELMDENQWSLAVDLIHDAKAINPRNAKVLYNMACCHARLGQKDEALSALEKAISLGFSKYAHAMQDEDLESLRDDERFQALVPAVDAVQHCDVPEEPQQQPQVEQQQPQVEQPPQTEAEQLPAQEEYQPGQGQSQQEEEYESLLFKLHAMGFFDDEANIRALRATAGSVPAAIDLLLP